MPPLVSWISFAPVKGLRLRELEEAELTADGIPGDRAFFLVDERGRMANAKRHGALLSVVAEHDAAAGRLALRFPDGREVAAAVELEEPAKVRFYDLKLHARPVAGPFSAALSEHAGAALRLVAAPPERGGVDRGRDGAVTLLSTASLERLREQAGVREPVDPRRFRMTLGIDGVATHAEDSWLGRPLRVGAALLHVTGHVGRCAVTTRDADSGAVDFQTLHHLEAYRGRAAQPQATEPLPFGVPARVLEPGRVRIGDAVSPAD
ncbi:MAG TPA: MOSC N-terminal beta barrel domain-containing protein [Conexibacter sp.]|nr:MOSC N-terminal beta barrel domain-containing protein [Conexibacter sp.]